MRSISVVSCFLFLSGCAAFSPNQVSQPTSITLDQALTDVVTAFSKAQQVGKENGVKLGIAPCNVTVTFNVTASASQGGKLVLDATIKAPAPIDAGGGFKAEQENVSTAARGNTIVMVLTSELCLPPNTSGANLFANIGKSSSSSSGSEATRSGSNNQSTGNSTVVSIPPNPNPTSIFEGRNGEYILKHSFEK